MIKLLLVDDHAIVRDGLATILGFQEDITVVGEAEDGEAAVRATVRLKPDVVLMDLMMPVMNGAEATVQILASCPKTCVLLLTSYGNATELAAALDGGAAGALSKTASREELISAIRKVVAGERVISAEIVRQLTEQPVQADLSDRQQDILHSLSRGLSNKEIAKQFGLSCPGVKFHLAAIFRKLDAANRAEAVAIALRRKILKG